MVGSFTTPDIRSIPTYYLYVWSTIAQWSSPGSGRSPIKSIFKRQKDRCVHSSFVRRGKILVMNLFARDFESLIGLGVVFHQEILYVRVVLSTLYGEHTAILNKTSWTYSKYLLDESNLCSE